MLGTDPVFLGRGVGERIGFCWGGGSSPVRPGILQATSMLIPSPTILGYLKFFIKTLGMIGVDTLYKGLLLCLDNLIYCFMWQN